MSVHQAVVKLTVGAQRNLRNLKLRYRVLQEVWQRGYSWNYRWYRFCEAFGLLGEDE